MPNTMVPIDQSLWDAFVSECHAQGRSPAATLHLLLRVCTGQAPPVGTQQQRSEPLYEPQGGEHA